MKVRKTSCAHLDCASLDTIWRESLGLHSLETMSNLSKQWWINGLDKQYLMKKYCWQDHVIMALEALNSCGDHPELLWRASRACLQYRAFLVIVELKDQNRKKLQELCRQSITFVKKSLELNPGNVDGLLFTAIGMWVNACHYSKDETDEVNLLKECKTILDGLANHESVSLDIYYWRGLWSFKVVTSVNLFDKIFFGIRNFQTLPSASIQDAKKDMETFVKHVQSRQAYLLLSKCHLIQKDAQKAKEYLDKAMKADRFAYTLDGEMHDDLMNELIRALIPDTKRK